MAKAAFSWDFYRTFLAVFREGSFSKAARGLGISQPTASRHIEAAGDRDRIAPVHALARRPDAD
jgi:hypothetical protein